MGFQFDLVVCVAEGVGTGGSLETTSTGDSSGTADAISSGVTTVPDAAAIGCPSFDGSAEGTLTP